MLAACSVSCDIALLVPVQTAQPVVLNLLAVFSALIRAVSRLYVHNDACGVDIRSMSHNSQGGLPKLYNPESCRTANLVCSRNAQQC